MTEVYKVTARRNKQSVSFDIFAHTPKEALERAAQTKTEEVRKVLGEGNFLWEVEEDFL